MKTNTLNFLLLRVRPIFREMEMLFCWTGHVTCPYNLLNRYIQAAGTDFSSSLIFFRSLHFVKSNASYNLRSTCISYTRNREVVCKLFLNWVIPVSYSASIVLDPGALPPLRMLVLMIGYLSAMDVGVQIKPRAVTLKII